jgi:hypothetical protein
MSVNVIMKTGRFDRVAAGYVDSAKLALSGLLTRLKGTDARIGTIQPVDASDSKLPAPPTPDMMFAVHSRRESAGRDFRRPQACNASH